MTSEQIRSSFLNFFRERGHVIVPSSSLVPDDQSVLLTTAGMQQFKRYFTGELDAQKDFGARRTASVQKCFRTSDIGLVGDETHLTFFEMLGNFSFGDYFKEDAINLGYEYALQVLGLNPHHLFVTVFAGDNELPFDKDSYEIWNKLGFSKDRIFKCGRDDNFWGPTGGEGPCGPTSEIYAADSPEDALKMNGVEIWNLVFNEYHCKIDASGKREGFKKLLQPGVDTGAGLERIAAVVNGFKDVFETDLLRQVFYKIFELAPGIEKRIARILADHLRGSVFLTADGIRPSNKEAGYILRRLLRRILVYKIKYDIHADVFAEALDIIVEKYNKFYPELGQKSAIYEVMEIEEEKYQKALMLGLKEIRRYAEFSAKDAFDIYQSFGLSLELLKELAPQAAGHIDEKDFDNEFKKHQEISRAGVEKKFGGHGLTSDVLGTNADTIEEAGKITKLHTVTHLLQQALRDVLGNEVRQAGSNITAERTRFDFMFPRKLTLEEIKRVEDLISQKICEDLPVKFVELPKAEAEKAGALHFFKEKYPDIVKVYYAGYDLKTAFSKEFCSGPHVSHTGEIGVFKIAKEEAAGAGLRRIRGVIRAPEDRGSKFTSR